MPKRSLVRGGRHFQFRNGIDGFYWKGMATKVDLGAQPPDRPRRVYNGRYLGGAIIGRQPYSTEAAVIPKYSGPNSTTIPWHPHALFNHHTYAGVRLWFGSHLPLVSSDTGGTFGYIDSDWDPEFNEVALVYNENDQAPQMERFANFIYFGAAGTLRRLYRFESGAGKSVGEYVGAIPADEVVASHSGFHIAALLRHAGKLYYVLTDPTDSVTGYIYSWDGFQTVQEYALTVSGHQGVAMVSYMNDLVVSIKGFASIIYRNVAGSWNTATVGGFTASGYGNSMAVLKDKLYIMGGADKIYMWDGSALTLVHTITGGTLPEEANCCAAWNGRLYYSWSEWIAADGFYDERWPWLGYYDPDTLDTSYDWKDDYVDYNFANGTRSVTDGHSVGGEHDYINWGVVTAMAVYRQRLMVAVGTTQNNTDKYCNIVTHSETYNPYSSRYIAHPNAYAVSPAGPIYFGLTTVLGGNSYRLIDYFKVL